MQPVVSVVIVSDYACGDRLAWDDLRATLAALSQQDFHEPAEFLLVECGDLKHSIPSDLTTMLPSLRVVLSPAVSSYELKNHGALAASANIVAFLDADCLPDTGWLRHLVTALRQHPGVDVVSGRTVYAGRSLVERALGLLSRSYLDRGRTAITRHIANNNAAYRRSVLLSHPLPDNTGPFGIKVQSEAILRAGGRLLFEPRMRVVHAFEGWKMERDIRRNAGYATIMIRRLDPWMPYAWMIRLGYCAMPLFVVARALKGWWRCICMGRHYGVAWYELPLALCLATAVYAMEIPGMLNALRSQDIGETRYR